MPPTLATFLTFAAVVYLFRRESKQSPSSWAMWIPTIWMLIIGSRLISQWFTFGPLVAASSLEEGSPLDRNIFLVLLIAGATVLARRHVRFSEVVRQNQWLTIFLVYCFISIIWSDFPFVAFKRWIKVLGHPIMILIVFTEPDRMAAITTLMKRGAYTLILGSVLFVKYLPEYGRMYDFWTGAAFYTGITNDKNALGYLCTVFGFFLVWHSTRVWSTERGSQRLVELSISLGLLAMSIWLLNMANAKTALVTFLVAVATSLILGSRLIVKKYIGTYLVSVVLIALIAEAGFGVYTKTIALLGRNPTLTDRTEVWADLFAMDTDPILGTGFESFWLGDRYNKLAEKYWWRPNQAHNGYIETYINLGIVGLILLIAVFIATYAKIRRELQIDLDWGKFRLALFFAILLFNYTDAVLKAMHPLWLIFYLIAMDYSRPSNRSDLELIEVSDDFEKEDLAFGVDDDKDEGILSAIRGS